MAEIKERNFDGVRSYWFGIVTHLCFITETIIFSKLALFEFETGNKIYPFVWKSNQYKRMLFSSKIRMGCLGK